MTQFSSLPHRIGRYRLIAPLTSRGFFRLYLAEVDPPEGMAGSDLPERMTGDSIHGGIEKVTVKVIHDAPQDEAEELAVRLRWLSGIRQVALVDSPHVVVLREVIDDETGIFLVAEHTAAEDAASFQRGFLLQEQRLPDAVAGRILLDALAGLEAIHRDCAGEEGPGQIHGHLHRSQLLVGVDGLTRIDDFSSAALDDWSRSGCQGPLAVPQFRGEAPEQLGGPPVSPQTDVWAAGVVAWELLGKRLDFALPHGALFDALFARARMPDLRTVRPDIPPAIAAVIARALEPAQEDRWPSAQALREALETAWCEIGPVADHAQVGQLVRARRSPPAR